MSREQRNLIISDELWTRVLAAAAEMGAKLGRPVGAVVWVREAIAEKLERDG